LIYYTIEGNVVVVVFIIAPGVVVIIVVPIVVVVAPVVIIVVIFVLRVGGATFVGADSPGGFLLGRDLLLR
jgi:hypothetical protein